MNKFYFNEHKQDTWKCDWLIGHIISIMWIKHWLVIRLEEFLEVGWLKGEHGAVYGALRVKPLGDKMSGGVPKDKGKVRSLIGNVSRPYYKFMFGILFG